MEKIISTETQKKYFLQFFVPARLLDIFAFHPSVQTGKYASEKASETDDLRIFLASQKKNNSLLETKKSRLIHHGSSKNKDIKAKKNFVSTNQQFCMKSDNLIINTFLLFF